MWDGVRVRCAWEGVRVPVCVCVCVGVCGRVPMSVGKRLTI